MIKLKELLKEWNDTSFKDLPKRWTKPYMKEYFPKDGFESTKLVAYALVNPHSSFKFASEKLASSTAYSGISYRQLSKSIFSVTSNIPSPFVIIPTIEDVNFFKNPIELICLDFIWRLVLKVLMYQSQEP